MQFNHLLYSNSWASVGLFVCLSVCLLVCKHHYSKSYEQIAMKFYGEVLIKAHIIIQNLWG